MIERHLNDNEIQQYVFQKEAYDSDIAMHIQHCISCKIKAEQYKLFFEGIKQQEKSSFDFNLADLVIAQLPESSNKVSNEKLFFYFIIFISIIFISIFFYFFRNSLFGLFGRNAPILAALIITAVTCLFVILCIDMFRKYQTQMKILNFY